MTDSSPELALRLSVVAEVLSALFRADLTKSFLEALDDEEFLAGWPLNDAESLTALEVWRGGSDTFHETEASEDWRADEMRLFGTLGHAHAQPYESVWLNRDHLVFGTETLEVREFYHRYGLQTPREGSDPDDHIGTELAFMARLLSLLGSIETDAATVKADWLKDVEIPPTSVLEDLRNFYDWHFSRFAPQVCDQLDEHASSRIYRALGGLTRGFSAELERFLEMA